MLDFSHIPSNTKADIQVFNNTTGGWNTWLKPRGTSMSFMLCLSGGGGGGAGASSAAGSGGTGGGSSSQSSLYIPTFMLPDTLYIKIGKGGDGGTGVLNAAGGVGKPGTSSIIAIEPDTSTILEYVGTGITLSATSPHITMADTTGIEVGMYVSYVAGTGGTGSIAADNTVTAVLSSTTLTINVAPTAGTSGAGSILRFIKKNGVVLVSNGGNGGPGGTTGVGAAGTASAVTTIAQCPLSGLGKPNFIGGQVGTVGSDVGNNGTAITYATTGLIVMGGSGGGAPTGGTATGMALTAAGVFPGITGVTTGAGPNGFILNPPYFPLRFTGGLGGAGGATSSAGGVGAYGCGGGGSGGCPAAATSVSGGKGGDGLVIIISY